MTRGGRADSLIHDSSAAAEAHCVLRRTRLSMDSLNIVGSVVNVSMARGPKDVCFGDDALLVPCLRIAVEAFCDSSNGDYLPSILLVVFERVGRDAQLRGQLRRTLLPSGHRYKRCWQTSVLTVFVREF